MTFDELPSALTSFLERESWVRVAASAYRRDMTMRSERDRLLTLALNGEVFYVLGGTEHGRILDPAWFRNHTLGLP
ncbi:hypothetical protein PQQ59_06045 [Paraburkholderia aspalathi]|uniref:hypothetical protein n=1 Tax=Paraburkholderia aspalathi TaxID=1324617 RepID=UPI0038BA77AF